MDEHATLHGMNIDDAYVVERRLAHGPAGTTELVTLGDAGPFVRKRLPRERAHRVVWAVLSQCESPRLPRIRTTYELPDEFVVVCDYVPGDTLAEVVEREGALAPEQVRALAHDLCEALADLHAHGAVHRDIAPANIVLAQDGAHLIDFGCAGVPALEDDSQENPQGTWGFAAPEQHGFTMVDARADLYAVGRVVAYAATGAPPEGNSARELRAHIAGLPEGLRAVIERACAFEPSARYQTAADLGAAFAGAAPDVGAGSQTASGQQTAEVQTVASAPASGNVPAPDAAPASGGAPSPTVPPDFASPRPRRSLRRPLLAVAALVLVAAIACGAWLAAGGLFAPANPAGDRGGDAQQGAVQQQDRVPSGGQTTAGADASTDVLVEEAAKALTITESSWYVSSGGFVRYAVGLANTDDDVTALFPTVLITGRDADGNVLFSDTQVLNSLFPGETHYWGGQAGNGAAPASVEFSIARPGDWEVEQGSGASSSYTVSGVTTSQDLLGGTVVTGELTFDAPGDEAYGGNQVAIVAIGRDAQGQMAWGEVGFVSEPAVGATVPFEVTSLGSDVPAYTTVEVHAYPW